MAGQVTRGSLSMTPSSASRASPQTAPAAVTTISNSAVCPCSASPEPSSASSPQRYPTRQNTSAFWPTKWLPGGATSRARPARKPVSTPAMGPPASASAATTSSTRSGPAPPGKAIRSTTVSWKTTVTATTTTEMTARTSVTARGRRRGGRRRWCGGGAGRGHGARRARRRGDGDRGAGRGRIEILAPCRGTCTTTPTTPREVKLTAGRTNAVWVSAPALSLTETIVPTGTPGTWGLSPPRHR